MATTELEVILGKAEKFVSRLVAKIALDIHANLIAAPFKGGTPVDTGWARANWVPRIGQPWETAVGERPIVAGEKEELDAELGLGIHPFDGKSGQKFIGTLDFGPQNDGVQALTGYRIRMGNIFITNNVPYIGWLNEGSSKQAPAGFVQAAIVKALVEDVNE
jgi:hypothetical protein